HRIGQQDLRRLLVVLHLGGGEHRRVDGNLVDGAVEVGPPDAVAVSDPNGIPGCVWSHRERERLDSQSCPAAAVPYSPLRCPAVDINPHAASGEGHNYVVEIAVAQVEVGHVDVVAAQDDVEAGRGVWGI